MRRLVRESLVRHGAAALALMIAAGLALGDVVASVVGLVLIAPLQALDEDTAWRVGGIVFDWDQPLAAIVTGALLVGLLALFWRVADAEMRSCPECRSRIPPDASVCAFCTADLGSAR